jgi:LytTr DNA-binding domain-containing protein
MNHGQKPKGRRPRQLAWLSSEYWKRSLGSFYSDFSHRLVIYLLVGVAYMAITYLTAIVLYGTAWLLSDLAHITAYAFHLALVFAGSLAVVDIVANRSHKKKLGYGQRTVGRQWLLMFVGFASAYILFRTTFHKLTEFYSLWLFGYDRILPDGPSQFLPELLFFFVFWLLMTLLIIQFARWNQRTASKPKADPAKAGVAQGPNGETMPVAMDGFLALDHINQNRKIIFADITHVTVEDHYCRLYHLNGNKVESHIFRMTLNQLKEKFPAEQFARIHRSHIVNLQHVLGWRTVRGQRRLVMDHGIEELPISRARYREIKPMISYLKRYQPGPWQTPAFEDNSSG